MPEGYGKKGVKFLVTGGIKTLTLYAFYVLLICVGFHYNLALLVDYIVGILIGYFLNRHWTFADQGRISRSFPKYCATYCMVYVVNLVFLNLVVRIGLLDPISGQVVALAAAPLISFLLQNFWVFQSEGYHAKKAGLRASLLLT